MYLIIGVIIIAIVIPMAITRVSVIIAIVVLVIVYSIQGSGFWVWDLRSRVWDSGFPLHQTDMEPDAAPALSKERTFFF